MNLIRRTCTKLMSKKELEINDIAKKGRPFIPINSVKGLPKKWLYDTGAGLTCMSLKAFRKIDIQDRPIKLNDKGRTATGASGGALVPMGSYLMPLEFEGKKIMHPVQVYNNLSTDAILGIDAIHNLGVAYLSIPEEFVFQTEVMKRYKKADLQTQRIVKIPAHTACQVRLGTAVGRKHSPMAAGFKSISTIANLDFPQVFSQPGLVVPDHQGDVTLILQNCSGQDIEIPRGSILSELYIVCIACCSV